LEHGLFKEPGKKNIIKISFNALSEDTIAIEIIDNGQGMTMQKIAKSHKSLATRITHERLNSFGVSMKEKIGLITENITSSNHTIEGYRVHLILPSQLILPD
jgi:signal transduction histidine kinase